MNKLATLSTMLLTVVCSFSLAVAAEHAGPRNPPSTTAHPCGGAGMPEAMQHGMAMRNQTGGDHRGYADIVLKHKDALKLNEEQIGRINLIHADNQRKVAEIDERLHDTMQRAHETYLDPRSDEAAVRKIAQEHAAAFDELLETTLRSRVAINGLLSPEQMQQLKSLK